MLYTKRLAPGWAAVYRATARQGTVVRFRTEELPYLGVWLCYGGWPDVGREPRQYAVALEPTVAPYRTLSEAEEQKVAKGLAPRDEFRFEIAFVSIGMLALNPSRSSVLKRRSTPYKTA